MAITKGWKDLQAILRCRIEPNRDKAISCYIAAGLDEVSAIAAADNMEDSWNPRSPLHQAAWVDIFNDPPPEKR